MEHVVGTAGHVDHGKSALVLALTGTDPDRLAEERRRGMTIELGFAEWRLRSGRRVGIVDVPGHQRLVRTMVAGAQGVDLVLLVVAADEGVMPQTREHVAVCDLLGRRAAVVALSRCDLVDADTAAIAAAEVEELLASTALGGAPIVPCSARDGSGLAALDAAVEAALGALPLRPDRGRARLFVDRAFSLPGFGPIVTGTLEGGSLRAGDAVAILPEGASARVRGLQRHGASLAAAEPGGRTAVNLAGVERHRLRRGMALAEPGMLGAWRRLDVALRCVAGAPVGLRHGALLDVHLGTAEVAARLWLLDGDELGPGGEGLGQLRLAAPLAAVPGDRLVLRRPAPAATLGGGVVLDVAPRRHRRGDPAAAAALERRRGAGVAGLVALELAKHRRGASVEELCRASGGGRAEVEAALGNAASVALGRRHLGAEAWEQLRAAALRCLAEQRRRAPLEEGIGREEWRSRLRLPAPLAAALLARLSAAGEVVERAGRVALPGGAPRPDPATAAAAERVLTLLRTRRLDAPGAAELERAGLTPALLRHLVAGGSVVRLPGGILVDSATLEAAAAAVVAQLERRGSASVAELRDLLGATRRVVVPVLEHLEARRVTVRDGDRHRLRGAPGLALR